MIITEQLRAFWKRLLSYTKNSWDIGDYPLRYRQQSGNARECNFGEVKPWAVQVINWWPMSGLGNSRQEAFEELKNNFLSYLEQNSAPRPGTKVPLRYSDTSQIDGLEDMASDFFENILDMDYYQCFISDESSLFDFGRDEHEILGKINAVYNLGLTELGDGNIVRLLKMIRNTTCI